MAKTHFDCVECGEECTVTSKGTSPVQCCPFCGNTLLEADNDDEFEDESDDDLHEFEPEDD